MADTKPENAGQEQEQEQQLEVNIEEVEEVIAPMTPIAEKGW